MNKLIFLLNVVFLISCKGYEYVEIPPATIWIKNNLFVDETEIRNLDWREYCYWVENVDPHLYIDALPDTSIWNNSKAQHKVYSSLYYNHHAYSYYPVTGVSYDQVEKYNEWRTNRVLEWMLIRDKKDVSIQTQQDSGGFTPLKYFTSNWHGAIPDTSYKFPVYRLPTKEEWISFSQKETCPTFPFGINFNKKSMFGRYKTDTLELATQIHLKEAFYISNYKYKKGRKFVYRSDITEHVKIGQPNKYGIYGSIGNVSEMTTQKGIAMGGNFTTFASKLNIYNEVNYDQPELWLGFRSVAQIMTWKEYQEYLKKRIRS